MLTTAPPSATSSAPPSTGNGTSPGPGGPSKAPNEKDNNGNRTKRKKARRACHACQRAHLTCGNERPCNRCVKRGIEDQCADGIRKKAKYLQDEDIPMRDPTASLMGRHVTPRAAATQNQHQQMATPHTGQQAGGVSRQYDMDQSLAGPLDDTTSSAIQLHSGAPAELYAGDNTAGSGWFFGLGQGFGNDVGNFNSNYANTEFHAMHHLTATMGGQVAGSGAGNGGVGTPDNTSVTSQGMAGFSPSQGYIPFSNNPTNDVMIDSWTSQSRSNSAAGNLAGGPHAFTIRTGPNSYATPSPPAASPQTVQTQQVYDPISGSPRTATAGTFYRQPHQQGGQQHHDSQSRSNSLQQQHMYQPQQQHQHNQHQLQHAQHSTHPHTHHQAQVQAIRRRGPSVDPSQIYNSAKEPYSYVEAYHRLFKTIDPRFTKVKQLRIARAFSAFRPSFIASTQGLHRADLVFQEKCCRRAITIYESSLPNIGTPTLICRRSGEVVVVGKEFSMLSGWPKEVLLGERPNLNTNIPHAKSDAAEIAKKRRRGTYGGNGSSDDNDNKDDDDDGTTGGDSVARPRPSNTPKPVFLLELLDDESVCEFYEDFSKLAFADSTGKVTRKCKILKYKPPPTPPPPTSQIGSEVAEEMGVSGDGNNEGGRTNGAQQKDGGKSAKRKYPQGQSPLDILGSSTTIECMMCWTLRRDVFGIPMLIILNFLPNLLQNTHSSNPAAANSNNTKENDKNSRGGSGSGPSGGPGNNNGNGAGGNGGGAGGAGAGGAGPKPSSSQALIKWGMGGIGGFGGGIVKVR